MCCIKRTTKTCMVYFLPSLGHRWVPLLLAPYLVSSILGLERINPWPCHFIGLWAGFYSWSGGWIFTFSITNSLCFIHSIINICILFPLNNSVFSWGWGDILPLCHDLSQCWTHAKHSVPVCWVNWENSLIHFLLNSQTHSSIKMPLSFSLGSSFKNPQFQPQVPVGQCFIATNMTSCLFLSIPLQKLFRLPEGLLTFLHQANGYSSIKCQLRLVISLPPHYSFHFFDSEPYSHFFLGNPGPLWTTSITTIHSFKTCWNLVISQFSH